MKITKKSVVEVEEKYWKDNENSFWRIKEAVENVTIFTKSLMCDIQCKNSSRKLYWINEKKSTLIT